MKSTKIIYFQILSAASLVILFTYTATSKILDIQGFKMVLEQSTLLNPIAGFISYSIPAIELLLVTLLLVPATRVLGFIGSLILLSLFTTYISLMMITQEDLPCSCGGALRAMTWPQHLIFNNIFMVIAGLAAWQHRRYKNFIAMDRTSRKPAEKSRQTFII